MRYICLKKPLSFGDKTYMPGETIPDGVVLSKRALKLVANGYLAETGEGDTEEIEKPAEENTEEEPQNDPVEPVSEEDTQNTEEGETNAPTDNKPTKKAKK